jgi:hypothetical protein
MSAGSNGSLNLAKGSVTALAERVVARCRIKFSGLVVGGFSMWPKKLRIKTLFGQMEHHFHCF